MAARAMSPILTSPTIRSGRSRPVLASLYDPPLDAGDADFDPSNLEVVSVDVGNPASNVIPAEVRLLFNVRFNALWTPETLKAEIARRVSAADTGRHTLAFDPVNAVAFLTRRGAFTDLVAGAVEDVTGRRPALSTSGGTSDARFIKDACPVVDLGLPNATIHAVDERVAVADIEGLSRIYERVLERYFAGPLPQLQGERDSLLPSGEGGAERRMSGPAEVVFGVGRPTHPGPFSRWKKGARTTPIGVSSSG